MKIGFDAKRAFHNATGLGNYSRFIIEALLSHCPENEYVGYVAPPPPEGGVFNSQYLVDGQKSKIKNQKLTTITPPSGRYAARGGGLSGLRASIWRSYGIVSQLKSDGIEVYHGLSNELPIGLNKTKIKPVVTIHDLIFLRYPELYPAIDRFFYKLKFRSACQNADMIVAVSEQTKRDIIEFYNIDAHKIKVIYQDCDIAFHQKIDSDTITQTLQKYGISKPYILSVGTIEDRKNQLSLVKAFYEANLSDTELVLVGKSTKYQKKIEEFIIEKNLQNRVKILNKVPFLDLPTLYQGSKVFAYLSFFEGFGIPIVEALHSGVPVLAATGSCLEEAGGGGGIYVNPLNINEIAKKLSLLWNDDSLRQTLIQVGKQHVKTFAAVNIAMQLKAVYERVVK